MKKCTRCGIEKELKFFYKRQKMNDGHCSQCIECHKKLYKGKNKYKDINKLKEYQKQYRFNNKEKINLYFKKWYSENKEKLLDYQKKYREENKNSINLKKNLYVKNKLDIDDLFKFKKNIRNRIKQAFKKTSWKKEGSEFLLGCSFEVAKKHIENQFASGMNWKNHGEWHIDHIIPLANAKTKEEIIALCNYKNLQPLWAIDNLKKGNKYKIV